jgi:hypothetical protein
MLAESSFQYRIARLMKLWWTWQPANWQVLRPFGARSDISFVLARRNLFSLRRARWIEKPGLRFPKLECRNPFARESRFSAGMIRLHKCPLIALWCPITSPVRSKPLLFPAADVNFHQERYHHLSSRGFLRSQQLLLFDYGKKATKRSSRALMGV